MKRREFIGLLGGAAVVAAGGAGTAAGDAGDRISWRRVVRKHECATCCCDFERGLAETGYVEGSNVAIEYRWADEHYDRLAALALDLVQRQVAVIAAPGSPAALRRKGGDHRYPDRLHDRLRSS